MLQLTLFGYELRCKLKKFIISWFNLRDKF